MRRDNPVIQFGMKLKQIGEPKYYNGFPPVDGSYEHHVVLINSDETHALSASRNELGDGYCKDSVKYKLSVLDPRLDGENYKAGDNTQGVIKVKEFDDFINKIKIHFSKP